MYKCTFISTKILQKGRKKSFIQFLVRDISTGTLKQLKRSVNCEYTRPIQTHMIYFMPNLCHIKYIFQQYHTKLTPFNTYKYCPCQNA